MPAGLDRAAAATGHEDRQVVVVVAVAVADAAAVDDHRVVKQRAIALTDRLQLAEQVGELFDVKAVDLLDLFMLVRVAAVVREVVVAFGNADEGVALVAPLVGEHEGADPGRVALEGEHHQVAHQADVLADSPAGTPVGLRKSSASTVPDFSDRAIRASSSRTRGQVFVDLAAVVRAEPP